MKIVEFRLHNVGHFSDVSIPLAPTGTRASNVTVFVGGNGAGKSSLLKALSTSLSWFVARLKSEHGKGSPMSELSIKNGTSSAYIGVLAYTGGEDGAFMWKLAKTKTGRKPEAEAVTDLSELSCVVNNYRADLTVSEQASLPLIALYPVGRTLLDVPKMIRGKHNFDQIDGYDNSLNMGVDFRRFFEWFREREEAEAEKMLTGVRAGVFASLNNMSSILGGTDPQLNVVRCAISAFMPGFNNLRVVRRPRLHMAVDKNGQTLDVAQLSDGERSLLGLVGDIARRLAMMNPSFDNPLMGEGIVLIDEVDLHLHPSWQRTLIARFTDTFPNCQFVLTTHSPLVISDAKDVLCYILDDGELKQAPDLYGLDANDVLLSVMDTSSRNEVVDGELNTILDLIQGEQLDEASDKINRLEKEIAPGNMELVKAKLYLKKQRIKLPSQSKNENNS